MKPWYLSKTLWLNIVAVGASFVPAVSDYVSAHPGIALDLIAGANFILRLVSKSQLQIS